MTNKIKGITKEQAELMGLAGGINILIEIIGPLFDLTEKSKREITIRVLNKVLEKRKDKRKNLRGKK